MMSRFIAICAVTFFAFSTLARADDVTDQINEALKAYNKKDYSTAKMALDAASTLISQKKADKLADLLPKPLSGWKAEKAGGTGASSAMFGGSVNAQRVYRKDSSKVTISITTDSPMLQAMSMMFTNPMFSGPNSKLQIINGRKVINDSRKNSLMTMVANKIMVSVKGNKSAGKESVKSYFKALDFGAIEKLAQ